MNICIEINVQYFTILFTILNFEMQRVWRVLLMDMFVFGIYIGLLGDGAGYVAEFF